MFEETVCSFDELPERSLKEFRVLSGKILIGKENGKVYACGTKCSHYGAGLSKGVIRDGQVRCPWHGACFSMTTGDIEDYPGLGGIPSYQAEVDWDGMVIVRGSLDQLKHNSRPDKLSALTDELFTVVIVGGGAAGYECAYTLRTNGFQGKIVLINEDDALPYDRTKLSKSPNSVVNSILLKSREFYEKADIETIVGSKVTRVDPDTNTVYYGDHGISYTKLFIASGTTPRTLDVEGSKLNNVHYLRNYRDANHIAAYATGKSVIVNGSSFIGMEVAAYLAGKAASVTVIGRGVAPFDSAFGVKIGSKLQQNHESKGDENGDLIGVTLDSGDVLGADLCVIGIGVTPQTAFLANSGIELSKGYIVVNDKMETNVKDIYAGGDVAFFPLATSGGKSVAIGHWQMAQAHGKLVALNILGQDKPLVSVPFFWSNFAGLGIRYGGHASNPKDMHIVGDLDKLKIITYFFSDGYVDAVMTMSNDPIASLFASLTKDGIKLTKEEILTDPSDWIKKYGTNV
ncbi:Apoptosis-inducing factor 3 [Halotydeus destructor]|nr:Apoptosis-inducing factor 3 [Halotydeus destructor]